MVEDITAIVSTLGFSSPEAFIGLLFLVLAVIGAIVVVVTIRPSSGVLPIYIH